MSRAHLADRARGPASQQSAPMISINNALTPASDARDPGLLKEGDAWRGRTPAHTAIACVSKP